jgi:hypothetical protein
VDRLTVELNAWRSEQPERQTRHARSP